MNSITGAETEYAVAAIDADPPMEPHDIVRRLYSLAAQTLPHLQSDHGSRIFVENGGCLYVDYGDHLEWATPECSHPWDLVRYVRAGDEIVRGLASRLASQIGTKIAVTRGNVGYGCAPTTWASHESYLSRQEPSRMVDGLVPFLCSRLVFCGGGGFDPLSRGIDFSLSPRTRFVSEDSSGESTNSRGIVHLKDEPLCQNFHRLHIICGDALGSEIAMWLRAGATALVVCLLNHSYCVPREVTPADPVTAMRMFASDPLLKETVPTLSDRGATALDIQWAYLQAIENDPRTSHYPNWAPKVLEGWRRMLEILQEDPNQLATVLDWTIKKEIYADFCRQSGIPWEQIPNWSFVLDKLRLGSRRPLSAVTSEHGDVQVSRTLNTYMRRHSLDIARLPDVLSLRMQLFEIEMRYLQLDGGLFEQLESDGILDHAVIEDRNTLADATRQPPQGTRAKVRGECVAQYADAQSVNCGWWHVTDHHNHRKISLDNPFTTSAEWQSFENVAERRNIGWVIERRSAALLSYCEGDYSSARNLLNSILSTGLDVPGTFCHLARLDLMTNDFASAAVHANEAWRRRSEASSYIICRILWLQIASAMLRAVDRPLPPLIGRLKTAMQGVAPYDWTMAPVLDHLRGRLNNEHHALLSTLADVLSGTQNAAALDDLPDWQAAEPEPLD
jgi:hypothetical protein